MYLLFIALFNDLFLPITMLNLIPLILSAFSSLSKYRIPVPSSKFIQLILLISQLSPQLICLALHLPPQHCSFSFPFLHLQIGSPVVLFCRFSVFCHSAVLLHRFGIYLVLFALAFVDRAFLNRSAPSRLSAANWLAVYRFSFTPESQPPRQNDNRTTSRMPHTPHTGYLLLCLISSDAYYA